MKKFELVMATILAMISITACGTAGAAVRKTTMGETTVSSPADLSDTSESNILIAYFTMPEPDGVDTVAGASRVVVDGELFGNNQYLATLIQEKTGGDLFRIDTIQEYPGQHSRLIDYASKEQEESARPELSAYVENLDKYDVIFLGYPNWWADLPMPMYTFLEQHDLSGKTIIPFNCHGGSRFSQTIETISEIQPNAEVITDGFTVSREKVGSARTDLEAWLERLLQTK